MSSSATKQNGTYRFDSCQEFPWEDRSVSEDGVLRAGGRARGGRRGPQARVRHTLQAAGLALLAEQGYPGFTIDALVSASGISKSTVYRWWDDRAHLALDTMLAAYGWPEEASGDDPIALVKSYLAAELAYHQGPAGVVLRGVFADAQLRPALAQTFRRLYLAPRQEGLETLLDAGVSAGCFRSDLDVPTAASMLSAPLWQKLFVTSEPLPAAYSERLVDTAMVGMSA